MAPSASDSPGSLRLWFTGLFNSSHSLFVCFAIGCVVLFGLAGTVYPIVAYGAFALFAVVVLAVVGRFLYKGPERDHALPSVTISGNQFQFLNVSSAHAEDLIRFATEHRRALPAPDGIIQGDASDAGAVRLLTAPEAERIRLEDESVVALPSSAGSGDRKPDGQS